MPCSILFRIAPLLSRVRTLAREKNIGAWKALVAVGITFHNDAVIMKENDDSTLLIMKHIRRAGGISRVALAQATGLTKGSVTELVARLVDQGLLSERVSAPSGRGRPRVGLEIVADAGFAVGLSPASLNALSVDIIDMNGDRIFSQLHEIDGLDVHSISGNAITAIEQAITRSGIAHRYFRHAGIILPGQVDRRNGVILWLPHSGMHEPVAIGPQVEKALGFPATIDNRATVVARAEHWFGAGQSLDNFSCIAILERGMGGARYRNGHLQTGFNGSNSEIAHIKIAFENGRACFCGASGCLGAYASVGGMIGHYASQTGRADFAMGAGAFAALVQDARSGNGQALGIFETAGRALGTAVASHINETDPGRILIVAAEPDLAVMIRQAFDDALREHCLRPLLGRTKVEFRTIAETDFWKGAASLALEQLYRRL